jgi:hypothetical protein
MASSKKPEDDGAYARRRPGSRSVAVPEGFDSLKLNFDHAANSPWTTSLGSLANESWPSVLAFHSFEPELAVADEGDNIW